MNDIEKLALDAIEEALRMDLARHCQEGVGNYEVDRDLSELADRAQKLGLKGSAEKNYMLRTYFSELVA